MPHNESRADRPEETPAPSKLKKMKNVATLVGMYTIPSAVVGASLYFGLKTQQMNYKTAALNLAAATKAAAE